MVLASQEEEKVLASIQPLVLGFGAALPSAALPSAALPSESTSLESMVLDGKWYSRWASGTGGGGGSSPVGGLARLAPEPEPELRRSCGREWPSLQV